MPAWRRELQVHIPLIVRGHMIERAVIEDPVFEAAAVDVLQTREQPIVPSDAV